MTDISRQSPAAARPSRLDLARALGGRADRATIPLREDRIAPAPLSFGQERLWFFDRLWQESRGSVIPSVWRVQSTLDVATLQRAFDVVTARHESLRTLVVEKDGVPLQVVRDECRCVVQLFDLRGTTSAAAGETEALRIATEESTRRFALHEPPLLRAALILLSAEESILAIGIHHLIADGASLEILISELGHAYDAQRQARSPSATALPIQYADFAVWQRGGAAPASDADLAYWRDRLGDAPRSFELIGDHPRPAHPRHDGDTVFLELPPALLQSLAALVRAEGATLFMGLLAGFQALLGRYSGQEDLVVGTPVANRPRPELEGLIGFFVNTLALRGDLSGRPSGRTLVRRAREAALGAFAHQELPFERLVEALAPERDLSRNPLFQIMF
ncbi:MAG: condensation domain-containing protein, partial [Gemmatimonadaceae bacterium]